MTAAQEPRAGEALKPCPFCGGKADVHVGRHAFTDAIVECDACNCEGPLQDEAGDLPHEKISKAIAAWNTRPSESSASVGGEAFDLIQHLHRQREFSERTFGPGARTAGVVDHIRKELREIEADPTDVTEWIDVVILAFDGAWRAGFSPEQVVEAIVAKQSKNEGRVWPDWRTTDPNKAIEHDRSGERTQAPAREGEGLRTAIQSACDLLAERSYGHAARSPAHNARLVLEAALSRQHQEGEGRE